MCAYAHTVVLYSGYIVYQYETMENQPSLKYMNVRQPLQKSTHSFSTWKAAELY